ncbi:MAG: hypothetical protein RIB84_09070 [Sneathiellaceae bacterium]
MQAENAENPSSEGPEPGRAWRRAGLGLVAACLLAVLTALTGQSPMADAWTALSPDAPDRRAAAGALPPKPQADGPLTALDRGQDDLAQVYRALHGGR